MKGATIAPKGPAIHVEKFSAASLLPALRAALEASSNGLSEALLMELVRPVSPRPLLGCMAATTVGVKTPLREKVRSALRRLGATCDADRRWTLPTGAGGR